MKVVERYFGPKRSKHNPLNQPEDDYEGYLEVEVNGRYLQVHSFFSRSIALRVPERVLMRDLEQKILREVSLEVFGR